MTEVQRPKIAMTPGRFFGKKMSTMFTVVKKLIPYAVVPSIHPFCSGEKYECRISEFIWTAKVC